MTVGQNADGTIDVRVVLNVRVDPYTWAEDVMGERPDEVLAREVRKSVKQVVRDHVKGLAGTPSPHEPSRPHPVFRVHAEGIYT